MKSTHQYAYYKRLSNLLELEIEYIRVNVQPNYTSQSATNTVLSITNRDHFFQYIDRALTAIRMDEIFLFINDAYKYGPIQISRGILKNKLTKLLESEEGIFAFEAINEDKGLVVNIEDSSLSYFDVTLETTGILKLD